ncbi:MAG: hypothetical protein HY043_04185 [Verrucomicrobia bacterium]|nr:hypothetical protein [Verrucomicrobiota bacterium]
MRNTTSWLALVLIAVALAVIWAKSNSATYYQGKPLDSWLTQLQAPNSTDRQAAEEAVRAIGTNAIPSLIEYLARTNTWMKVRATGALSPVANRLGLVDWDRWSENFYHSRAMCGFRTLGTNAQPATPALLELLASPQFQIRRNAAFALSCASPNDATKEAWRLLGVTNTQDTLVGLDIVNALRSVHYGKLDPEFMKQFTNVVLNRKNF